MLCSAYDFSEPYHTDDLENVSRATEFMDVDSPIVAKKLFFPVLKYTAALRKGVTISEADNKVEQVAAVGRMSPTPPRDQLNDQSETTQVCDLVTTPCALLLVVPGSFSLLPSLLRPQDLLLPP